MIARDSVPKEGIDGRSQWLDDSDPGGFAAPETDGLTGLDNSALTALLSDTSAATEGAGAAGALGDLAPGAGTGPAPAGGAGAGAGAIGDLMPGAESGSAPVSGSAAARFADSTRPAASGALSRYRLNSCVISSINCIVPSQVISIPQAPPQRVDITLGGGRITDPDVQIPNVAEEDY